MKQWTPEELSFLHHKVGEMPFFLLCQQFQARWPRTQHSIANQLRRQGLDRRIDHGEWLNIAEAARILGKTPQTFHANWLTNKRITAVLRPVGASSRKGTTRYVRRSAWRRLASQQPALFGGIEAERLFALFEDRSLADSIAAAHPCSPRDFRVRCVESGRTWPSIRQYCRRLSLNRRQVDKAVRNGRPLPSGLHLEVVRR